MKSKLKSSLFWVFIDTAFLRSFTFIITIILARILSPEDFGLIALISIFILLGSSIIEGGMGNSIIRDQKATEIDYSSVFFGNIFLSFFIYSLLFFFSPFIADYFEKPILKDLIRVYSINLILSAFFNIQQNVLTKRMNFKKITLYNLPAIILGSLLGLLLAYYNYGVWSLVYMNLSISFLKVIIYWKNSDWLPNKKFSWVILKKHFNFGYKLMLSSLLDICTQEIYTFLIGKKFSIETLGHFRQAKSLRNYPVNLLTTVLSKVTYPMLSKIQNDKERTAKTYRTIIKSVFFIVCPIMFCFILIAKPLFTILLTTKWLPSVPYFQLLAVSGMLIPIHTFNINILKVYARTDLFLKLEIIKVFLTLVSIVFGLIYGVYGILIAIVIISILGLFINTYYSGKLIDYSTKAQLNDMLPSLVVGLFSASISYYVNYLIIEKHALLQILTVTSVFIITYIGLSILFNQRIFTETRSLVLSFSGN